MPLAFLALMVGLGQGLLHAMGPDHCAAVVTLTVAGENRRRSAVLTALRFAAGHAVVLGALAAFCLLAGVGLSEAFERWAEIAGGIVLVGIAATALLFPGALRHGHPRLPGHGGDHHHHPRPARARLGRPQPETVAGALMAVSGVRSLLLALPPLVVGGSFSAGAWAYLPGFTLGILLGMGAMGLLVSEGLTRISDELAARFQRLAAFGSAAVGLIWIGVSV